MAESRWWIDWPVVVVHRVCMLYNVIILSGLVRTIHGKHWKERYGAVNSMLLHAGSLLSFIFLLLVPHLLLWFAFLELACNCYPLCNDDADIDDSGKRKSYSSSSSIRADSGKRKYYSSSSSIRALLCIFIFWCQRQPQSSVTETTRARTPTKGCLRWFPFVCACFCCCTYMYVCVFASLLLSEFIWRREQGDGSSCYTVTWK